MNPEPQAERAYTIAEAAKYFGKTYNTVRVWCANGTLLAANCRTVHEKSGRWIIYIPESTS